MASHRLGLRGRNRARSPCATSSHVVRSPRPELQRVLDRLTAGPEKLAPGAAAYVSGPRGSWLGAAGVEDEATGARMPPDARVRLESVSKIYTATLILQLARAGKLRVTDTVARWLPGLLPYGKRITLGELLTMRSGLIDNNDRRNHATRYLAHVEAPALRRKLVSLAARVQAKPDAVLSPMWWIRWAAWVPLRSESGTTYHYSNIGYDILGLVAERAGGKPLAALYREQIFEPLRLDATAYDPQGPIDGRHARGHGILAGGKLVDTTDWHYGVGADGGIVSTARDTGSFLTAATSPRWRPQPTAPPTERWPSGTAAPDPSTRRRRAR